jgi:hypothetical protein
MMLDLIVLFVILNFGSTQDNLSNQMQLVSYISEEIGLHFVCAAAGSVEKHRTPLIRGVTFII